MVYRERAAFLDHVDGEIKLFITTEEITMNCVPTQLFPGTIQIVGHLDPVRLDRYNIVSV